mmetsp:Transcript_53868/g.143367  ORF Transcript_53868/g.143367 Transcript_53868/m.143367 type:complete len:205 (-) Transcript_53868:768-1382(-)
MPPCAASLRPAPPRPAWSTQFPPGPHLQPTAAALSARRGALLHSRSQAWSRPGGNNAHPRLGPTPGPLAPRPLPAPARPAKPPATPRPHPRTPRPGAGWPAAKLTQGTAPAAQRTKRPAATASPARRRGVATRPPRTQSSADPRPPISPLRPAPPVIAKLGYGTLLRLATHQPLPRSGSVGSSQQRPALCRRLDMGWGRHPRQE